MAVQSCPAAIGLAARWAGSGSVCAVCNTALASHCAGWTWVFYRDVQPSPDPERAQTASHKWLCQSGLRAVESKQQPQLQRFRAVDFIDWQAESAKVIKSFSKGLVADFPRKGLKKHQRRFESARSKHSRRAPFAAVFGVVWPCTGLRVCYSRIRFNPHGAEVFDRPAAQGVSAARRGVPARQLGRRGH